MLQDQAANRAVEFLPFLFGIGYGTQVPLGAMWIAVTLEALSHFVIEVLLIAHFATLGLDKLVARVRSHSFGKLAESVLDCHQLHRVTRSN